ncbi:hypothetical protein Droror1_Dr00002546 [Drosera rotundifolia]
MQKLLGLYVELNLCDCRALVWCASCIKSTMFALRCLDVYMLSLILIILVVLVLVVCSDKVLSPHIRISPIPLGVHSSSEVYCFLVAEGSADLILMLLYMVKYFRE